MTVAVRLKTGFFKTSVYELTIDQAGLRLVPDDPQDKEITLTFPEILSVTLRDKKQPLIEIQTSYHTYAGVFHAHTDFQETLRLLKQYPGLQIVCEYGI